MSMRILAKRAAAGLLSVTLIATLAFAPLTPAAAPRAQAFFGLGGFSIVFDPSVFAEVVSENARELAQAALRRVAIGIAKMMIQSITRSTIQWINSGFEGRPGFVTNLKQDLQFVKDNAAAIFISELQRDGSILSPYGTDIARAVAIGYYLSTNPQGFLNRMRYDLGNFSSDPSAFTRGDFSKGGLDAWRAATKNCGNSAYCSYLAAQEELHKRVNESAGLHQIQLDWASGFRSWDVCVEHGSPITSGEANAAIAAAGVDVDLGTGASGAALNEGPGTEYETRTPGTLIEGRLGTALNTDLRQLELADSIDAIVDALLAQAIRGVFDAGQGLLGLDGGGSSGGGSGGGSAPGGGGTATSGSQVASAVSTALAQLSGYRQDWEKVFGAASAAETTLGSLAACLRGNGQSAAAGEAEQMLSTQVRPVADRSRSGVTDAQSAQSALQDLQSRIQSVSGGSNASVQLSAIAAQYDQLLRTGLIPTQAEIGEAVIAASENPAIGTSDYLLMVAIREAALEDLDACES
jgi:hypothetical protein